MRRDEGGFDVRAAGGERARARKLLLATGMRDRVPDLPGLEPLLGAGVYHCPDCDGWEVAGGRAAGHRGAARDPAQRARPGPARR
ncbi:MAG TPA: hypothetical protein VFS43_30730 [Polyangiaceae bacterium]|nr:hypothetical protein [Polyangiaceae bacterium]